MSQNDTDMAQNPTVAYGVNCRPDAREAIGSIRGCKLDVGEFSRELSSKNAICHRKRCTLRLNFLENSSAYKHVPVTLLSPLSPSKKGANALYIGILSPCHPFLKKS